MASETDQPITLSANGFNPSWLPSGDGVVYGHDTDSSLGDIDKLAFGPGDSITFTNLTHSPSVSESQPAVSPNGQKIAYIVATNNGSDVWTMDIAGGSQTQLTHTPNDVENHPNWSPDGSQILFDRLVDATNRDDIFMIDTTGFNERPVVSGPDDESYPTWSPDGTMIAFERQLLPPVANAEPQGAPGVKYHIFVANANGSGEIDISPESATGDFTPDWGVSTIPLIWGDNNCSGAYNPLDALATLVDQAQLGTPTAGCPQLGQTLHTASFGDRIWGDLNCSNGFDPPDVLLLLRDAAGLPPANLQNCPALGIGIALQAS